MIQEKILRFDIDKLKGISVTHGYYISNTFPVHFHSNFTLGIIEQGDRELSYRGMQIVLHENDIFMIQPFEPHSCKPMNHPTHCYKMISMPLDPSCYFPRLKIADADLLKDIRKIHTIAEYENSGSNWVPLYDSIVLRLRKFAITDHHSVLERDVALNIQKAKAFIEKNCHMDISLYQLASLACLSEYHFNRYFHKCYGLSPYAYYLVCKMKKSQGFLLNNNSVTDTTYEMGFFDQSHFSRLFKKHIGVSPGKFLRDNKPLMKG